MEYKMEECSIEITYACPMNCLHCSSRAGSKNDIFIPKEKIFEIIDKCKQHCGTETISLSGGEPLEHPDFWEILEYIKNKGLKCIIYTCGITFDKMRGYYRDLCYWIDGIDDFIIRKLSKYCNKIIFSLQGTPEIHNKIMDIGDKAFYLVCETIKGAIRYGIETEIHFVPTKLNFRDIKIVYGICIALGVSKMSVLRYVPQGRGLENEIKGERLNLNKIEFYMLNKDMQYLRDMSINSTTKFRIGVPADFTFLVDYIYGEKDSKKPKPCSGGKDKILIKADGLVQVCPAWKELNHLSAGNIYKEDIVDIWNRGKTYLSFRSFNCKNLKEPCKSCIFLESCYGGCGAQRILNSVNKTTDDLCNAPDPLCFLDFTMSVKREISFNRSESNIVE